MIGSFAGLTRIAPAWNDVKKRRVYGWFKLDFKGECFDQFSEHRLTH